MDIITSENPTNPTDTELITPGLSGRKKRGKKEILKSMRKFFTSKTVSLSLLKIILIMMAWAIIFFIGGEIGRASCRERVCLYV